MLQLEFKNATFHKGINLTVRLGLKWYDYCANGDDTVELPDGIVVEVVDYTVVPFGDIDPRWLYSEHDPECRDINGLAKVMHATYGAKFDNESVVTLLWFEVK